MNQHSSDRVTGALRRKIVISAGEWCVRAAVEDDRVHDEAIRLDRGLL